MKTSMGCELGMCGGRKSPHDVNHVSGMVLGLQVLDSCKLHNQHVRKGYYKQGN